jgi:hypothetical protein
MHRVDVSPISVNRKTDRFAGAQVVAAPPAQNVLNL